MAPTDPDWFRHVLAAQGTLVGKHEKALHDIIETLSSLSSTVTALDQVSTHLSSASMATVTMQPSAAPPASPASQATPAPLPQEPHMPIPECYSGELGSCRLFLLQRYLMFEQQPATYHSDKSKIVFVVSLLSGWATSGPQPGWSMTHILVLLTISLPLNEEDFSSPHLGQRSSQLTTFSPPGSRSVADFSV